MSLFPPLLFSFFLDFIFHLGSPLFFLHNSVLRSRARFLLSLPPIVFPLFFIHFFSRSSARSFFYLRFFFLIFNSVSLRPCSSVAHRSFSPPLCSCSCLALRASFTPSRLSPTVYSPRSHQLHTHACPRHVCRISASFLRIFCPRPPAARFFMAVPRFSFSSSLSLPPSFLHRYFLFSSIYPPFFSNQSSRTYVRVTRTLNIISWPAFPKYTVSFSVPESLLFPFSHLDSWIVDRYVAVRLKKKIKRERERELLTIECRRN